MSLQQSMTAYLENKGVTQVTNPVVGQRVVVLILNEFGFYIPPIAQVVSVTQQTITVLLYSTGNETRRTIRANCFTHGPADWWCGTTGAEPAFTSYEQGLPNLLVGVVYKDRIAYERLYPKLNPETDKLEPARVKQDWISNPASFHRQVQ